MHHSEKTFFTKISNQYASLPQFAADEPTTTKNQTQPTTTTPAPIPSKFRLKAARRQQRRRAKQRATTEESDFIDQHITWAKDERTSLAKGGGSNPRKQAIDAAHLSQRNGTAARPTSILQRSRNLGYAMHTSLARAVRGAMRPQQLRVRFAPKPQECLFAPDDNPVMLTYDSGANGNYLSESDRRRANLPILRRSTKRVGVANGGTSHAVHTTTLPFPQLSAKSRMADTFRDFPSSLMSVGKTADDGKVSIFTRDGVTVHNEEDVLITCKGRPVLVGKRDDRGRYRIPLVQERGHWQPRKPSRHLKTSLRQANSVYDLPSTEQAIKWMHAVCGYPVKST